MDLNAPVSCHMTKNVKCVGPHQKIVDLKHIYEQQQFHHHIPVTENNKLVGMVSLIDFMRAIHNASLDDTEAVYQTILVKDIMSQHPVTVGEGATMKEVAELLAKGEFHSIVVVEDQEVRGIITTADLLRLFLENT